MKYEMFFLALLLLVTHRAGVGAQLSIGINTLNAPSGDGTPNTFIGTGSQIASSLLGSTSPALLWGVVSSADVNSVCQQIVNTGSLSFNANVEASGFTESLSLQVTATGGCLAASDASGTEAVMVDNDGRQSALVCPSNVGSTGCGIYLTGDDVTNLYNQGARRRLLASRKLLDCASEAGKGAIGGAITGVLAVGDCLPLGILAPFCIAGVLGVSAELGAAAGCVGSCFPGDALVTLASGDVKHMTALALGDKVAVRKQDGLLAYEDVYAFGHQDPVASTYFVQLTLKPVNRTNMSDLSIESKTLELSDLHFAPVSSGLAGKIVYKRAQDIQIGDKMWAQGSSNDQEALPSIHVVTAITRAMKEGLYNPFTLGGTIIVNGVVASTHSDWFLDNIFQFLGVTHWLPAAYQLVLFPVRMLYMVLGKDMYISIYHQLDSVIDVAEFGTKYGESILTTVSSTSVIAIAFVISKVVLTSRG